MNEKNEKKPDVSHKAVALRYNKEKDSAPRIVAKGGGLLAEKIIATAREHGITIYEDKELIELLSRIELYQVIPIELYQIIAEVLAFVYRVNKNAPRA